MTFKLALLCFACFSVGGMVGLLTAALCFAARHADDEAERAEREAAKNAKS